MLPFLKPGDVLTHCFTGHAMKIVDDDGRLLDVARRAWESGVVFDVGHGTGSFSFETAEAVMAAGRKPDVISTDLHQLSVNGPTFDLPTTLSKFLHLGMSLPEVIEAATVRPAQVLGLERRGRHAAARLARGRRALPAPRGQLPAAGHPRQRARGAVGCCATRSRSWAAGSSSACRSPPRAPWTEEPIWPDVQIPFTEKQRELREQGRTPDAMAAAAGETT